MDKRKIEAMVTKFSEKFVIFLLKSIENFVGVAWLIWMPRPFLKKSFRYIWATLYNFLVDNHGHYIKGNYKVVLLWSYLKFHILKMTVLQRLQIRCIYVLYFSFVLVCKGIKLRFFFFFKWALTMFDTTTADLNSINIKPMH